MFDDGIVALPPASAIPEKKQSVLEGKHVERPTVRYAAARGYYARKFSSPAQRSVPDDIFTAPGGFTFYIEFKAPGRGPSSQQADEHTKIRRAGGHCYVVDDPEVGKAIVDHYLGSDGNKPRVFEAPRLRNGYADTY